MQTDDKITWETLHQDLYKLVVNPSVTEKYNSMITWETWSLCLRAKPLNIYTLALKNKLGSFLHWSNSLLGYGISPFVWKEHPHTCKEMSAPGVCSTSVHGEISSDSASTWSPHSLPCVSGWPASQNLVTNCKVKMTWKLLWSGS